MPQKFLIGLALLCTISCAASKDEVILATVGTEKIRAKDLKKIFEKESESYDPEILQDTEGNFVIKKNLLNGLIQKTLLRQYAREKHIALTPEEKQALSDQLRSGYSEGELQNMLAGKKMAFEEWVREQEQKKVIDKLIDQEVYSKVPLTDEEIRSYYQKNRFLFREPDRIHCRHIVTNKKEKTETILSLLKSGENFAALAKKYSESPDAEKGGDLGFIAIGEYPAVFQQACFTLNTGQTSEVVSSEYGFHIFRVVEKRPGRQLSVGEATPEILKRLRKENAKPALRAWLDSLYQGRKILVDEKALKEVSLLP